MIHSFLNQYQTQEAVLVRTMQTHPEQLDAMLAVFQEDLACNKAIPLTDGNPDNYITYFYNLLAMVAMFGSITGLLPSVVREISPHWVPEGAALQRRKASV